MPIKKNDLILVFVPHDYAQKTGLVESGCLLPLNTTEESLEIIICDFLEYDDFGGLWIRANYGENNMEIMIPRDIIVFIISKPSINVEKIIGFEFPEEYKKRLDK